MNSNLNKNDETRDKLGLFADSIACVDIKWANIDCLLTVDTIAIA